LEIVADLRIGISGFRYTEWRKVFYPKDLPQRRELAFASEHFNSIEINGSFYSLQRPQFYQRWYDETPPGFVFAVKGGRFITHMKKLKDVETPLANFFASGVLRLADKLGPVLWQFPENLGFDDERFTQFFELLPRTTREAARLSQKHAAFLNGRTETRAHGDEPLRHAVEIRSETFRTPEFIALLRKYNIALVVADTAGRFPYLEDVTADFVYVRLHGDSELYRSGYSPQAIARWAERVKAWSSGSEPRDAVHASQRSPRRRKSRDVYVYFDNDAKVHAPFDAMALAHAVGLDGPVKSHPFPLAPSVVNAPPLPASAASWRRRSG
jgi:uncharacterized protein YecE (DUF72 family)